MLRKVGEAFVKRTYNRFRERYFSDKDLPEWGSFELCFKSNPGREWGMVIWEKDGQVSALYLDNDLRLWPATLKMILLHEMTHMVIGSKLGHGKKFYAEALRAMSIGAIKECF